MRVPDTFLFRWSRPVMVGAGAACAAALALVGKAFGIHLGKFHDVDWMARIQPGTFCPATWWVELVEP